MLPISNVVTQVCQQLLDEETKSPFSPVVQHGDIESIKETVEASLE